MAPIDLTLSGLTGQIQGQLHIFGRFVSRERAYLGHLPRTFEELYLSTINKKSLFQ